jgi:hypothetical protein
MSSVVMCSPATFSTKAGARADPYRRVLDLDRDFFDLFEVGVDRITFTGGIEQRNYRHRCDVGSTAMGKPRVNFDVPAVDPYYRVSWENPQMATRYQRILEDPVSLRAFTEELKKIILRSRRASPDLCGARWQQS